jgi:hypothetical protein
MKVLEIKSKKHGLFKVLLDDDDYEKVTKTFKTPKWCVRVPPKREGLFYFQKRMSDKSLIEMHRWIVYAPKGTYIDHINNNCCDNRKENLRIVTNSQNLRNAKLRKDNKTGCKGLNFDIKRKVWEVKIKVNYKSIYLGKFTNYEDAVKARKEAEIKYW